MNLHTIKIIDDISNLNHEIKNIINSCWKYVKYTPEKIYFKNEFNFIKINSENYKGNSNYHKAIRQIENDFGCTSFYVTIFNIQPRFDVMKSRNSGFSFHGRNYLLIAFKIFETNHIEISYVIYTEWL